MLTLIFQSLSSLGLLALGWIVATVCLRLPEDDPRRAGWYAAAVPMCAYGISAALSGAFAILAFANGPGTSPWNAFLRAAPGANLGRNLLVYVLIAALLALCLGPRGAPLSPRARTLLWAACLAVLAAGAWLGIARGPLGPRHYADVALLQAGALAGFCAVLLLALRRDALEGTLWLALAVKGFSWAMDTPLVAILVLEIRDELPPPWVAFAVRTVFTGIAVALVAHRLLELRAGTAARPLVLPEHPRAA